MGKTTNDFHRLVIEAFLKITASVGLELESLGQTREQGDKLIEVV